MAQVLVLKSQMTMDNYIAWFRDTLSELHTFVSVETDEETGDVKFYYTQDSYLLLDKQGTDLRICAGNSNFEYTLNRLPFGSSYSGADVFCIMAKSASGDVTIRTEANVTNYYNHDYYIGTLLKCRDTVSGTDTWGFSSAGATDDSGQTFVPNIIITDDAQRFTANTVYPQSGTGTPAKIVGGWNPYAQITALVPMCAVSSRCIALYTYFMLFSPRFYDGDTVINGKHYYCIGGMAMLDEAVT